MFGTTQIYILIASVFLSFGTGAIVEHKFSLASKFNDLVYQVEKTKENQISAENLSGDTGAKTKELNKKTEPLKEKLYEEVYKNPDNCVLPARTIQLLTDTASAASHSAR